MTTTGMTPKEEASHDAYVAGLGGHTIECSMCQAFTITVKDGEDENVVLKHADMVRCVDCGEILCDECGINLREGVICEGCISDRGQEDNDDIEDSSSIEWNGFNRPSTY